MKFSLQLAQHCNKTDNLGVDWSKIDKDEIVERIGIQLGEVEAVDNFAEVFEGVVIAKIVDCRPHPGADKLSLCIVDDAQKTTDVERDQNGYVQVICGAPNVAVNEFVAWVTPGSNLPSTINDDQPVVIGAKEVRGEVSQGMLASLRELGIGDNHDEILLIDQAEMSQADAKAGDDFSKLYGLEDTIIDIENKMFTHRPDCFGNLGVAREVAAIFGQTQKNPDWLKQPVELDFADDGQLPLKIFNDAQDLVPRFTCLTINDLQNSSSPTWLGAFLTKVGVKPVNNIVDFSNYYMMLTAQPTHAFDYDKVKAKCGSGEVSLGVRNAKKGEKIKLLGGKIVELQPDDLVIATDKEPVALAGIMGGADCEVDANTTSIIIECATFDMYQIRKTSMRHGLFTDAVTRYSKGQSPLQNEYVAKKLAQSLGGTPVEYQEIIKNDIASNQVISVEASLINKILGTDISAQEIGAILQRTLFEVDLQGETIKIKAPYWRTDIHIAQDIVEEVGRLFGYYNINLALPLKPSTVPAKDVIFDFKQSLRRILSSAGASEALSYSFIPEEILTNSGQDPKNSFKIINALSPELQYYRQSITPSLLSVVYKNIRQNFHNFALFETNKIHTKLHASKEDEVPPEPESLALVVVDVKSDQTGFFLARAYLESLFKQLNLEFSIAKIDGDLDYQVTKPFESGRSGLIMVNKEVVGVIGEYKMTTKNKFKLPKCSAGFELSVESLHEVAQTKRFGAYSQPSSFPKSHQDLTLKVAKNVDYVELAQKVERTLQQTNWASTLQLKSIFSDNDETKNVSFSISVASRQKTLTTEEVSQLINEIVAACQPLGAEQV